jgi:hypothetical protein
MTDSQIFDIRARSARLFRLVTALVAMLWLLFVCERFGAATLRLIAQDGDHESWRAFGAQFVLAIPEVFYLLALGGVRRALGEFARGELYAPTIALMLHRVGVLLAAGAFIGVFVVPGLLRAIGADPGYWIAYDVSGLVLGALGLSFTVIARVFRHAAALKAELDGIF